MHKWVFISIASITISGFVGMGYSEYLNYQKELKLTEMALEEYKAAIQNGLQQCVDNDRIVWKKECLPFE